MGSCGALEMVLWLEEARSGLRGFNQILDGIELKVK
jgi:hypothetical protein